MRMGYLRSKAFTGIFTFCKEVGLTQPRSFKALQLEPGCPESVLLGSVPGPLPQAGNGVCRGQGRNWAMRKAIAQLDSEQREALIYLADVALAMFSAALIVSTLQFVFELVP
jgi:hypothetical protein